jgi:PleD family two-component response regulator
MSDFQAHTKRILLVDDDARERNVRSMILSTHGYDVEAVSDSDTALQSWKTNRPDLVLVSLSPASQASFDRVQEIMRSASEQPVGYVVNNSLRLSALFFNDVMIRHPEEAEAFMNRVQALFS